MDNERFANLLTKIDDLLNVIGKCEPFLKRKANLIVSSQHVLDRKKYKIDSNQLQHTRENTEKIVQNSLEKEFDLKPSHGKRYYYQKFIPDYNDDEITFYKRLRDEYIEKNYHAARDIIINKEQIKYGKYVSDRWNEIRLLWIAFFKNRNNDKCYISKIPKEIIFHIQIQYDKMYLEWLLPKE